METQKYPIDVYKKVTSAKMKHSNLLVLVFLLFIKKHYRKTKKEKIENKTKQQKKNWNAYKM